MALVIGLEVKDNIVCQTLLISFSCIDSQESDSAFLFKIMTMIVEGRGKLELNNEHLARTKSRQTLLNKHA